MKQSIFLFLLAIMSLYGKAQSADDSVKAVVNQLFAAMKNSDAALLQDCFADSAILQTITAAGRIRDEKVGEFVKQISSLPINAADERITFAMIKVDGSLASVWTPYQFFYNGQFSHCGANSFQLVRLNGKWKIQYLIDTRRRQGCQ